MYECHITIEQRDSESRTYIEMQVTKRYGWRFSAIDGDPVLGAGVKCYATRHFGDALNIDEVMEELDIAAYALENAGLKVIRKKIELIIFDKLLNG